MSCTMLYDAYYILLLLPIIPLLYMVRRCVAVTRRGNHIVTIHNPQTTLGDAKPVTVDRRALCAVVEDSRF